jgi:hypothetical protein
VTSRLLCASLLALALASPAGAKALIEMGWDEANPAFLAKHMAQIEAQPFDGLVYVVGGARGGTSGPTPGAFTWKAWGNRRWTEAELASEIRTLESLHWTRYRHNFLRINATPGNVDWFEDYSTILANLTLAASIARRAGSRGILIDPEAYESPMFEYPKQKGHAKRKFADYAAQTRRRGAEVMRALEKGYPGLTVFLTIAGTHADIQRRGDQIQFDRGQYGLLPAFVEGLVDGASSSAKIVDGMGGAYPVRKDAEVDNYFSAHDVFAASVPNSAKYRKTVSRGLGIWMDFDWRNKGWNVDNPNANYRSPEALRKTLVRALSKVDEYVWLYCEIPRWWNESGKREKLPDAYVQAVRDARKGLLP